MFIHKGTLKLLDAKFKPSLDIFVVLLSDYVVLTEQRSKSTKKQVLNGLRGVEGCGHCVMPLPPRF